jgi:hypothetical protein
MQYKGSILPEDDGIVIDLLWIGGRKALNQIYRKRREKITRRTNNPAIIPTIHRMYSFVLKDRSSS